MRVVRHYQGKWEIGEVYPGFYSLDGKLVCDVDMPSGSNRYFLRPNHPSYHVWTGSDFSATYVEVDGYVTSGYDPAVLGDHQVLHVTRVSRIAPPTAGDACRPDCSRRAPELTPDPPQIGLTSRLAALLVTEQSRTRSGRFMVARVSQNGMESATGCAPGSARQLFLEPVMNWV